MTTFFPKIEGIDDAQLARSVDEKRPPGMKMAPAASQILTRQKKTTAQRLREAKVLAKNISALGKTGEDTTKAGQFRQSRGGAETLTHAPRMQETTKPEAVTLAREPSVDAAKSVAADKEAAPATPAEQPTPDSPSAPPQPPSSSTGGEGGVDAWTMAAPWRTLPLLRHCMD